MHAVQPTVQHPLVWALHSLLGLSLREIAESSKVSHRSIARYLRGSLATDAHRVALRTLLERTRDRVGRELLEHTRRYGTKELDQEFGPHRRAVYETINRLIRQYATPERSLPATNRLLLEYVGQGRSQELVHASFREIEPKQLWKIARRLGIVRTRTREGVVMWRPPGFRYTTAPPAGLRSKRASKMWIIVERMLLAPAEIDEEGYAWVPGADIEAAVLAAGYSRPLFYRTARDMRVRRKTEGFGAAKRTWWSRTPSVKRHLELVPDDETP